MIHDHEYFNEVECVACRLEARQKIIEQAKENIDALPEHQREYLRQEFERAERVAEWIRTHPGSVQ